MASESGSTSHLVGFLATFPATFPAPSQPPYESVRTDSSTDNQLDEKLSRRRRPGRADTNTFTDLLTTFYPNLKQPDRTTYLTENREYREHY